jgi:hypothetical protein
MAKKKNTIEEAAEAMKSASVALLTPEEILAWRDATVRTGTACKCGTHCSINWQDGGVEWFEGHVLEHHVDEKRKLAQMIRMTVYLPGNQDSYTPDEVMGILGEQREQIARRILGQAPESDAQETLGDA